MRITEATVHFEDIEREPLEFEEVRVEPGGVYACGASVGWGVRKVTFFPMRFIESIDGESS